MKSKWKFPFWWPTTPLTLQNFVNIDKCICNHCEMTTVLPRNPSSEEVSARRASCSGRGCWWLCCGRPPAVTNFHLTWTSPLSITQNHVCRLMGVLERSWNWLLIYEGGWKSDASQILSLFTDFHLIYFCIFVTSSSRERSDHTLP